MSSKVDPHEATSTALGSPRLEARKSELSEARRALLARRLGGKKSRSPDAEGSPFPRRPDPGRAPLSLEQKRLWRFARSSPQSGIHNVRHAASLDGPLDIAVLCRALAELVRRHETLRTCFAETTAGLEALSGAPLRLPLPLLDLSELPKDQGMGQAELHLESLSDTPFDLTRAPLFRWILVRRGPKQHILMWIFHHIIIDGWSLRILKRELITLYDAFYRGQPSPLTTLPMQYGDFALWQHQRISGLDLQRQYWHRELAGAPEEVRLRARRLRPLQRTYSGSQISKFLSRDLSRALDQLAQDLQATLFIIMLAAFKVLLHRFSRQRDLVVGTPSAARPDPALEGLVGNFLNYLPLRTVLDADPTFRQLVAQVREKTLEAYSHQDYPYEQLAEDLDLIDESQRAPLFQIVVNQPGKSPDKRAVVNLAGGVVYEPYLIREVGSEFDLLFYVNHAGPQLRVQLAFDAEVFEPGSLGEMCSHFWELLEVITIDPDRRISSL